MKIDEGMCHVVAQDVKFDMGFGPLPLVSLTGPQLIKFHDKRRLVSKFRRVSPRSHLEPVEFSPQAAVLLTSGFLPASRSLWLTFFMHVSSVRGARPSFHPQSGVKNCSFCSVLHHPVTSFQVRCTYFPTLFSSTLTGPLMWKYFTYEAWSLAEATSLCV